MSENDSKNRESSQKKDIEDETHSKLKPEIISSIVSLYDGTKEFYENSFKNILSAKKAITDVTSQVEEAGVIVTEAVKSTKVTEWINKTFYKSIYNYSAQISQENAYFSSLARSHGSLIIGSASVITFLPSLCM